MKIIHILTFLIFACTPLIAYEKNIAILVRSDFRGEYSLAHRVKAACENIHWNADILPLRNTPALRNTKYDFAINLVPGIFKHPKCKNYLAIFDPVNYYFTKKGFLKEEYKQYDGYLLTYSPKSVHKNNDFVDGNALPYMQWYPSVQWQNFQIVNPLHLFHLCCSWGDRFNNKNFQQCLSLLDKESYTRFYGTSLFKALYPNSYQGEIPYDEQKLLNVASQAGITLVLHSSDHNAYGVPSGRIFEAAAASTIIICDQNPFVKEHFGDSVLYINTSLDGQAMFDQIHEHMSWIKLNKAKALEKAAKAHTIFKEKFLLEDQLLRLAEFHDLLSTQK